MNIPRFPTLPALAISALLCGCAGTKGTFMETMTDSQASKRILKVRAQPESLGHKRLAYHSLAYPGIGKFLQLRGEPDFIIEDHGFTSRQIVIFYLKQNQAYLFETKNGLSGTKVQASGPEPIGKKTRAVLEAIDRLEKSGGAGG